MNEKRLGSFPSAAAAVLLSILLTAEARAAAPVSGAICSAQANENPLVKGRSKTVTFPDGRDLTVVGHLHGNRQIYEIADLASGGRLVSMSDTEFNQLLARIDQENRRPYPGMITQQNREKFVVHFKTQYGVDVRPMVRPELGFNLTSMTVEKHALEDFRFLSQALAQEDSKIQFIGFEGSQETWVNNAPHYVRARQELLRQFNIRKTRGQISFNHQQIEKLILTASTGSVYAYMMNPNIAAKVPMFGSEDQSAGAESLRVDPLNKMSAALEEVVRADDAYWDSKTEQDKQAFKAIPSNMMYVALLMHIYTEVQNMNVGSYAELDAMVSELRAKSPTWIQPSLESLFGSLRERVRINFARDYQSARNLAGRYESGIHFVGLNHFNNTIRNLEDLCKQELNGFSPTPVKSVAVQ